MSLEMLDGGRLPSWPGGYSRSMFEQTQLPRMDERRAVGRPAMTGYGIAPVIQDAPPAIHKSIGSEVEIPPANMLG